MSTTDPGRIHDSPFTRTNLTEICHRADPTADLGELCRKPNNLPDPLIPSKATNTTQLSSAQHACLEPGLHAAFLHQDHSSTLTPISILYVEQFIALKHSTFERLHVRLGMGYASHTY
ncbi:uncharacterized protein UDID_18060 [Ustilago sp. UG-2017a]|nr:uncharacterized protein UDID_18060 [Ustilago sp. UG-2017a]